MAFTVEDGTIVTDANAYVTVAAFRTFHGDRGVDVTAATDTQIEDAIVKATDYVDKRFGVRFIGWKSQRDQSLMWPRIDAMTNQGDQIYSDEIPKELKNAVFEYGFLALYMSLLPVPAPSFNAVNPITGDTTVSKGGLLQRERTKVGPIEEETWYNQEQWRLVLEGRAPGMMSDVSSMVYLPEYPVADEWLKPIIKTGNSIRLSRG